MRPQGLYLLLLHKEYEAALYSEPDAFKQRIVKRAKEKIEEAMEEERLERKCFESQDIGMLQQIIKELPEEEARYGMG